MKKVLLSACIALIVCGMASCVGQNGEDKIESEEPENVIAITAIADCDAAIVAYNEFLQGKIDAVRKDNGESWNVGVLYENRGDNLRYALFDVDGGIPMLITLSFSGYCYGYLYQDGKVVFCLDLGNGQHGPIKFLENGAILCEHTSTGSFYRYITIGLDGDISELNFIKPPNSDYPYEFDGKPVSEEEWNDLTKKYFDLAKKPDSIEWQIFWKETTDNQVAAIEEEPYYDKIAKEMLENLKNGNYREVAGFMGATDPEAYKFIQDMKVDSYAILESADVFDSSRYYLIKFNMSESDSFVAGAHYWDLFVGGTLDVVVLFRPSNYTENKTIAKSRIADPIYERDREYRFCTDFSNYLGLYETADDFSSVIREDGYWGGILHGMIHFYLATAPDALYQIPVGVLEDYMAKTTGITGYDYTKSGFYSEYDVYEMCGHGGDWQIWQPASKEYDENTKTYTVVIDYYADAALFVVAQKIVYEFSANDDGSYKMLSIKVVYDSGYPRKCGSM